MTPMLGELSNVADAPIKIEAFSQKKMTEFVCRLAMFPAGPLLMMRREGRRRYAEPNPGRHHI
jgi:hypothetical protein